VELIVNLIYSTGDRETKEATGQSPSEFMLYMSTKNWIRFDDDEFVNMSLVRSFKVLSKAEKEEQDRKIMEDNAAMLRSLKF
jgi:hypothetical protein